MVRFKSRAKNIKTDTTQITNDRKKRFQIFKTMNARSKDINYKKKI